MLSGYFAYVEPRLVKILAGDNNTFRCLHNSPEPSPLYLWSFNGGPLPNNAVIRGDNGDQLILIQVDPGNNGQYECNVTTRFGDLRAAGSLTVGKSNRWPNCSMQQPA